MVRIKKSERKVVLNPHPVRKCSVHHCNKTHWGLGYCQFHYSRHKADVPLTKPHRNKTERKCSVRGCDKKHCARGLCQDHYNKEYRVRKQPKIELVEASKSKSKPKTKKERGLCPYTGCTNKTMKHVKGYCSRHAYRYKNGLPMDLPKWVRYSRYNISQRVK